VLTGGLSEMEALAQGAATNDGGFPPSYRPGTVFVVVPGWHGVGMAKTQYYTAAGARSDVRRSGRQERLDRRRR
jgi:hypothetical protein